MGIFQIGKSTGATFPSAHYGKNDSQTRMSACRTRSLAEITYKTDKGADVIENCFFVEKHNGTDEAGTRDKPTAEDFNKAENIKKKAISTLA